MQVIFFYGIGTGGIRYLYQVVCRVVKYKWVRILLNVTYNGALMDAFLVDKDSLQVMFLHLTDVRHLDMFAVCNEKEFIKRVLLGD